MGSRDVVASDVMRLRATLLFLNLGAWSGEKEHTDFVLSKRQSYMDMLRRSGLLQPRQQCQRQQESDAMISVEDDFQHWQKRESTNRLVYSWVLVDQELGLFGDWESSLNVNDLKLELPCHDDAWRAVSVQEWLNIPQAHASTSTLYTLFMQLRRSPNDLAGLSLTPLHLRLLLHPLQKLIHSLVSCLNNTRTTSPQQTKNQVAQLQTAQSDLATWYQLMQQCMGSVSEPTPFVISNMIMYHLVSLNTMTFFPDIELLARGHITPAVYLETFWLHSRHGRFQTEAPKIFWHCGSVLRLFQELRDPDRPRWLPSALYRAALTMWAASFANGSSGGGSQPIVNLFLPANPDVFAFAIDRATSLHNDPAFDQYWHHRQGQQIGVPAFFDPGSGTWVCLANTADILVYCAHMVKNYDVEGKLADRVHHDLLHLSQRAIF